MIQTENDIQTGDSLLITTYNSFISKTIVKVMRKYNKQRNINCPIVLSHAARFIRIAGELYVFGSIDSGYKPWLFKKHYSLTDPNEGMVIMRRKTPLTDKEKDQTTNYCLHLTTVSFMYQYWALLQWLLLVYLKIDTFKKDSDKTNYCYESEHECRKDLNPESYGETYKTPFHILINDPNYRIEFNNTKT